MAPAPKGSKEPPDAYVTRLEKQGFRLERRLGHGAFGTVYRGVQIRFNRPVAVKFFTPGPPVLHDDCERFEREALLLARIEHPGIPYVITSGSLQHGTVKVPYFVMQFVDGTGLDSVIVKQRKLPVKRACEIMVQLLDALHAVHAQQILHRDIKPNNVIVSARRAWLVDFTLGVSLRYEPGLTRGTRPQQGLGVPDYCSPEQLSDAQSCDHRTDIYACGIVLFEMLAGYAKLVRNDIASQLPDVPPALHRAIQRATAERREDRYDGGADFAADLEPFVNADVVAGGQLLALCTNLKCGAAKHSQNGYFFGPRVEITPKRFCDACGGKLVRHCQQCEAPLSASAPDRVTKQAKSAPDGGNLFCADCGALIFEYPICKTCRSLLTVTDMGRDTAAEGCGKCARESPKKSAQGGFPEVDFPEAAFPENDDIPF